METLDEETLAVDRERLGRALQELEAVKARVERDASAVHEETRSKLVAELLPVLDNFDRAIAAAESNGDAPTVVDGVRMVRRQLENVLLGYGLARFDAVGAAFDPSVHEATNMIAVADPHQDHRVVDQSEPGYMFGDRLLRAAKVVVGRHM
jgi:molecular chaperone GrpE